MIPGIVAAQLLATGGAPADQELEPSLYVESDTFFTPVVAPGVVDLLPTLYTETDTFETPVVQGEGALSPALYVEADTFETPVITTGAVDLTPSLYVETDVFFTPTVAQPAGATPTFRSGTSATTTANVNTLNIAYPAGLADKDIFTLAVTWAADGETLTTPAGFTQIGNTESPYSEDAGTNDMHSAVYWYRADGTETGNLTLTKSGAGGGLGIFYAAMAAYEGCLQSGSPIDTGPTDVTDATSPYTMGSVTTSGANRRVVSVFCVEDNNARTTGPASGWTNRVSLISGIGLDGTIVIDDIEQVSAGSPTDNFFGTGVDTGAGVHAFALLPNPA